jgi:hypothetical protein
MEAAIEFVFGTGRELNALQMTTRAPTIFIVARVLVVERG